MNLTDPERADAVAGEYVLGTLRGQARARFEHLAHGDRRLSDAVHRWEERLLPLAEALRPVAPPSRVWVAVLQRIRGNAATRAQSSPKRRRSCASFGSTTMHRRATTTFSANWMMRSGSLRAWPTMRVSSALR